MDIVFAELSLVLRSINLLSKDDSETKTGGKKREPGTLDLLSELLTQLMVFVKKREPRECTHIMDQMMCRKWPENYGDRVSELSVCIKRYRFREAETLIENLMNSIGGTL